MNITAILVANGFGIANMLMLLLCGNKKSERTSFSDKVFCLLIWTTIGLCLLEAISFLIDGKIFYGAIFLSYLINCLLFATIIVFAILWIIYLDYRLFEDINRIKRRLWLIVLPGFMVLILIMITPFYPILFNISNNNVYARTIYTNIVYIVCYGYLIGGEILLYINRHNSLTNMFFPSLMFITPLLICSIIQIFIYGISITWASLSISIISLYINIHGNSSHIDQLSGVYNRAYWEADLNRLSKRAKLEKAQLVGILLDVDNFKRINDNYGHLIGDEAIKAIGRILRSTVGRDDLVARFGGDEFIVMLCVKNEKDIAKFLEKLSINIDDYTIKNMLSYKINFSYGYTFYNVNDSVDSFFARMDKAMYVSKSNKRIERTN